MKASELRKVTKSNKTILNNKTFSYIKSEMAKCAKDGLYECHAKTICDSVTIKYIEDKLTKDGYDVEWEPEWENHGSYINFSISWYPEK